MESQSSWLASIVDGQVLLGQRSMCSSALHETLYQMLLLVPSGLMAALERRQLYNHNRPHSTIKGLEGVHVFNKLAASCGAEQRRQPRYIPLTISRAAT